MIDLLTIGNKQVETTNHHSLKSAISREHLTKLKSQICDLTSIERRATTSWMRLSSVRMHSDPQRCLDTLPQHRRRLFFSFARTDVSQSDRTANVSVKVMSHTRMAPWDLLKYASVIDWSRSSPDRRPELWNVSFRKRLRIVVLPTSLLQSRTQTFLVAF
jgi:hypothetical protein